jgi:WD40 repeat protein
MHSLMIFAPEQQKDAHHGSLYCIAWGSKVRAPAATMGTPDGQVRHRLVATGSNDRQVKLWRAQVPTTDITTAKDNTADKINNTNSKGKGKGNTASSPAPMVELRRFKGHPSTVRDVAFTRPSSGTPSLVSVGAGDFGVRVWDLAAGVGGNKEVEEDAHTVHLGHTGVVFACAVLQGAEERGRGSMIVSASEDGTLRVWDPRAPVACRVVRCESAIHSLAASPVNTWTVATGHADGRCVVWDLMQARELYSPHRHSGDCRSVDYSSDGRWLLSGAFCGTVAVSDVDVFSQSCVAEYHLPNEKVLQARWHPSGTAFVTSSAESVVKLWTVQ